MTGILNALIAGVSGAVKDAYFNLVSLLLPGNGTNGAQNNTFLDSSTNNFTITRNGDTTQGTFSPFSQTGWGANFDGTNDYCSLAGSSDFSIATSTTPFTVEAWVNPRTLTAVGMIWTEQYTGSGNTIALSVGFNDGSTSWVAGRYLAFGYYNGSTWTMAAVSTTQIDLNAWSHVAYVFTGSTCKVYLNGVDVTKGSSPTPATTWGITGASGDSWYIGSIWTGSTDFFNGYVSNLRYVVGTAVYTGNFTPSTTPLTNITNTKLLTLQSNRFVDNSSSPKIITANNGVAITPFSPFAPTQSYSAAAVGGSGYFDGTGDYLTAPTNAAFSFNADFTIECWVYGSSLSTSQSLYIVNASGSYLALNVGTTSVDVYLNTSGIAFSSSATIPNNSWNHVAMVRSGSTVTIYVNGNALPTTGSSSATLGSSSSVFSIAGLSGNYLGYLSNFRVIKGTAVYTGAFTPPTKPLATSGADSAGSYPSTTNVNTSFASSACSLLLNFTNAGVVDATAKNDLLTVGTAQISTTQSKFGGGSIYLNGTGNYLTQPFSQLMNQLNGNFTIECWIYPTVTNTRMLFAGSVNSAGLTNWYFEITSSNKLAFNWTNTVPTSFIPTSTASISPNTWTHVAVVKNGGTLTLYINGSADGTASPTGTYAGASYGFSIGRAGDYNGLYFTGYIDDFRMTIGQARTITLPTAPFPLQ